MLIGLVADTHDNLPAVLLAARVMESREVELVLHAGDHVAPFSLRSWNEAGIALHGVYGNNDGERRWLAEVSGGRVSSEVLVKELGGRKILVVHEPERAVELVADGERFDAVVCGHTHERLLEWRGETLWINPGEASGWLSGQRSVAVLDTETMEVEFIELTDEG